MKPEEHGERSRLASGATVTGEVDVEGHLRIEGTVDGHIRSGGAVTVVEGATVEGGSRRIGSRSREAADVIKLEAGAAVDGSLLAPSALIEEGARVNGDVTVGAEPQAAFPTHGTEAPASS